MGERSSNRFLVNFVGQAGGGKSTMLPVVAATLNKQSRENDVCKIAKRSELKSLMAVALHPFLFSLSFKITKKMKGINTRRTQLISWVRWIRRLGLHTWHAKGLTGSSTEDIWLFDEGIVHYLRKTHGPLPGDILNRCPLPHMVVNIKVDKIQAIWRRLLRTNHSIRYERLKKGARSAMAEKYCMSFIRQRGVEETRDFLQQWSVKFCRPPLSDVELAEIISKAEQKVSRTPSSPPPVAPGKNWLRLSLESLGVVWIDIDTSDGNSVEKNAQEVADQIWRQYLIYTSEKEEKQACEAKIK